MGVRAHASPASWGQRGQLRQQRTLCVKKLMGTVTFQPLLQLHQVRRFVEVRQRQLMGPPGALYALPIHVPGPRPPFGGTKNQHRPQGPVDHLRVFGMPREALDLADLLVDDIQRPGQRAMDLHRLVILDKIRIIAIAIHEAGQLLLADHRQHAGVGDLVTVQMQDGQHRAVAGGVEELVAVPAGSQWPGFGLTITNDARHDQLRIVQGGTIGMGQRIAQFAPFVNGARHMGADMAANAIRPGKLPKEPGHSKCVALDRWVELGVGTVEVCLSDQGRTAVARPRDEQHIEAVLANQPVQMGIDEVEPRGRPPVAQQPRFDIGQGQGPGQQGIALQIDLANGEVVRRPPIGVQAFELFSTGEITHASLLSSSRTGRSKVFAAKIFLPPALLTDQQ